MLIAAYAVLFLCMFGFALFIPLRAKTNIFEFTFIGMILSLYISWFVFLISYYTLLGDLIPWLAPVAAIGAMAVCVWRARTHAPLFARFNENRQNYTLMVIVFAAGALLAFHASQSIGQIFQAWDAVASWNRWAAELSRNEFRPYNAAYPILWPAIWSLIYEAQGHTNIWYLPRASLLVLAFGVLALLIHTSLKRGIISFILLFVPVYFALFSKEALYSGYMDQPSALLGLAALLMTFLALSEPDGGRRQQGLLIAVVTASLAVMTKQHGLFAAISVCSVVAVLALLRRISFVRAAVLAGVFIAPIGTFLLIYLGQQDALWGNISALDDVTARAVGGRPRLEVAFERIGAEMPLAVWVMLVIGVLANAAAWRDPRAWFGALVAALSLPGFLIYAECCSYSERNGMWIFSHLIIASFIGYSLAIDRFAPKLKRAAWLLRGTDESRSLTVGPRSVAVSASFICATAITMVMLWPQDRLLAGHLDQQRALDPRSHTMLARQAIVLSEVDRVISSVQLLRHHPEIGARYMYCGAASISCFQHAPYGRTLFITAPWFENEASNQLIDAMIESGSLASLDQERGARLFRLDAPPPAVLPPAQERVHIRMRNAGEQLDAAFSTLQWRSRSGGPANALVSPAGIELHANTFAISVDALPAEPGARYRLIYEGVVLHPGTIDKKVEVLVGPIALDSQNNILVGYEPIMIDDIVARVREGGDGRFSGERIITVPSQAESIHMGFHGTWHADWVLGPSRSKITMARLERVDD